jgi:hypothetical protein
MSLCIEDAGSDGAINAAPYKRELYARPSLKYVKVGWDNPSRSLLPFGGPYSDRKNRADLWRTGHRCRPPVYWHGIKVLESRFVLV